MELDHPLPLHKDKVSTQGLSTQDELNQPTLKLKHLVLQPTLCYSLSPICEARSFLAIHALLDACQVDNFRV